MPRAPSAVSASWLVSAWSPERLGESPSRTPGANGLESDSVRLAIDYYS